MTKTVTSIFVVLFVLFKNLNRLQLFLFGQTEIVKVGNNSLRSQCDCCLETLRKMKNILHSTFFDSIHLFKLQISQSLGTELVQTSLNGAVTPQKLKNVFALFQACRSTYAECKVKLKTGVVCIFVARGGQKAMPPQMFRKYSHFALWVAFFQTKWCYSPKIKHFAPPKVFGLATPLIVWW